MGGGLNLGLGLSGAAGGALDTAQTGLRERLLIAQQALDEEMRRAATERARQAQEADWSRAARAEAIRRAEELQGRVSASPATVTGVVPTPPAGLEDGPDELDLEGPRAGAPPGVVRGISAVPQAPPPSGPGAPGQMPTPATVAGVGPVQGAGAGPRRSMPIPPLMAGGRTLAEGYEEPIRSPAEVEAEAMRAAEVADFTKRRTQAPGSTSTFMGKTTTVPPTPKTPTFQRDLLGGKPVVWYLDDDGNVQVVPDMKPIPRATDTRGQSDPSLADPMETARNIVNNPRDLVSLRSVVSMRGQERQVVFNAIKRLNPDFPVGMIDRQIKFLDGYEDPKGRAALNRQSMNNILMHAADLSDVNQQYRRTDVRIMNTALNTLARQYREDYVKYQTVVDVLREEIALYFAGGYAPFKGQEDAWGSILNGAATPAQIEAFSKNLIHVGLRRASTHNADFKSMMGYDDPNMITPDAFDAGVKLGLGEEMRRFGSGGRMGQMNTPAAAPSATDPYAAYLASKGAKR